MIPESIELSPDHLTLRYEGRDHPLTAALLRQQCRCTHCQAARLQGRLEPTPATLLGCSVVGHYALQLHFSDGHERGIYPWAYLLQLTEAGACL